MSWTTGILGLGSVAVDDLIFAPYAPPNVKTPVSRRERHFGGQAATALYASARLGAQSAYAGVLGTDQLSLSAIENMRSVGIDLEYVRQIDQAHAVYSVIIVDEVEHTRNIYYHSSPYSGATEDWPPEEMLRACKVLMVDQHGIPGMTRAARIARTAGIPIVSDLEVAPPGSEVLFTLIDHLIIPESFALAYTGKRSPSEAATALWTPQREVVVITCGEKGCWYLERNMVIPEYFPAYSVPVVDTTGCGDVFHGVYAVGLIEKLGIKERIRLASAAAAMKATKTGGQAGCPNRAELDAFLHKR
jgi:sulfofructose kinase